jgi:prefoldin subunit 5
MRATLIFMTILVLTPVARAAEPTTSASATVSADSVIETLEVKRQEIKAPEHESLRFLKDHRVFVRSQLDRLRTQVTREHTQGAEILDARYLKLKEMSAAIAAAQDTIGGEEARAAQQSLLCSVTELGQLEASLDHMDSLLVDERTRLLWLEKDFLGHQETALVIVIHGLPAHDLPSGISIADDGEITHVTLSDTDRASLALGGIAQIYHEFVEPRTHALEVRLEGGAWDARPASVVTLEAARDRLTFLELDLGSANASLASLNTRVWYR